MSVKAEIERFINIWTGTAIGESVKNMYDNGTDPEYICDYAGIEFDEEE